MQSATWRRQASAKGDRRRHLGSSRVHESQGRRHERVAAWLDTVEEHLFTTPLIVAEIDHLVSRNGGPDASSAFYEDLTSGAYLVEWWPEAVPETVELAREHPDIGLADASLISLSAHLGTTRIATLDERHFRVARPLTGEAAFTLLPTDA